MNILMVSMDFPPTVGGIAAHVYELSHAMAAKGHKVNVVARALKHGTYPPSDLVDIRPIALKFIAPLYGLQIRSFIRDILPEVKPDIIHIHGMGPLEWYNITAVPLVYTNHTSGYLNRIKKGGIRRMALLKRLFKKPLLFLAPSRELLEVPFPITAVQKFIPNGVDSAKYMFDPELRNKFRKKLDLQDNQPMGILTRRMVPKNGVAYLAKAAKYITNDKMFLLLIGDGPEKEALEGSLYRYIPGRYRMLGAMKHDEIIPYYSAADFSVLPSLMEATSISGLEAMASGLPLVGTRVGGIPELIEDGKNGFLCEPANEKDLAEKIDLLLSKDLRKLGDHSRAMVERKFDWQKIADQTLEAYESVL